ncbi:MAG: amidohydrolase family protein [Acidobacteria bacterium]|nr:amidohydrolase family protein [Acidobacteriota bacterium]
MRALASTIGIVLAATAGAAPAPAPVERPVLAVVGATLWDGTGAAPIPDSIVVVRGERVVAAGPRASVRVPAGAEVLDGTGRWLIPGLIDAHVHFFQSGGLYTRPDIVDFTGLVSYADEVQTIRERLDETFRRYLASGVTAVVDAGGPLWNFDVRRQALASACAPRVAVAGPLISTVARPQLALGDPPIIRAASADDARRLVRAQLPLRPDFIKVWYVPTTERPASESLAILEAAADEAHRAGLRLAVHATERESARAAVAAGADILVHSVDDAPVDDDFLRELKAHGTIYTTTLVVLEGYAGALGGGGPELLPVERRWSDARVLATWREFAARGNEPAARQAMAARRERAARAQAVMAANLRALATAGVTIAAGTDAGNIGTPHGPALHRELVRMAEAGLEPRTILLAATRDAARVFAREPEIGTIAPGKLADMLLVEGDPLADIANVQRIARVVRGGSVSEPRQLVAPSAESVVQDQLEAYNARDLERFVAQYAPDAILLRAGGDVAAAGREAIRALYRDLFRDSPALRCTVLERTVDGALVADDELVTGLRGGPPVRALAVYEVADGLIQRVHLFRRP